jgi:hypothetical protein
VAAAAVIGLELATPCPPGGWLALDCGPARSLVMALIGLSAVLYVTLLTLVVAWSSRASRRGTGDPRAARDWYLVAAVLGLVMAPLLAFSVLAGLGWLG